MKQKDVKRGESYLFHHTDVPHRKFMEGTVVTVSGIKKGKETTIIAHGCIPQPARKPTRFKLTNGQYANAGDLRPLPAMEATNV